jgi:hypothetical protein
VHGSILNATELSYIIHLPIPEVLSAMPCIERVGKTYSVPHEFTTDGPVLGTNIHRGSRNTVRHSPRLPNQHIMISGKSGYGKTNLMLTVALQRINNGDGVIVITFHSSLITEGILPRIPKHRIKDVIYFNAGDFEHPVAINPMAHRGTKMEREHIRVDLLKFFEDLFETPLGVNVQHALNFCLITLLTRSDSTLFDLEQLMIDKSFRKELLSDIHNDRILIFWEQEFPLLEKRGIITTITNKLSPLLLPDSTVAPMLSERESKIDSSMIMKERKLFLCNLSIEDIGEKNANLLGMMVLSDIQISAMMRKPEGCYPDSYCFIDEFQHVYCPSMSKILSGARKYGLHLCLASQMMSDIPDYILRHAFN